MALGVPIIHAVEGESARIVANAGCGVCVPSGDAQAIVDQARKFYDDGAALLAMGDAGRKAAIEKYLLNEDFPATVLHPGHLVGSGWTPLNPAANFNPKVFEDLAQGNEITLPNFGRETLHHVHADDVAQAFMKAMTHRANALGESFHVVSPKAVTMIGYAESVAAWHGREAKIRFEPWQTWSASVSEKEARTTWDHIARSPNCSIEKARRLLDYNPRYTSLEAIRESLLLK